MKVLGEITYHIPNFICCIVDVWEWISNSIPYIIMDAITYPLPNIDGPVGFAS